MNRSAQVIKWTSPCLGRKGDTASIFGMGIVASITLKS